MKSKLGILAIIIIALGVIGVLATFVFSMFFALSNQTLSFENFNFFSFIFPFVIGLAIFAVIIFFGIAIFSFSFGNSVFKYIKNFFNDKE
jgi:hypothetical protein